MRIASQLSVRVVLALALAGAIAVVVSRQNAIARLRVEQAELSSASQEAARLAEENQGIAALRDSSREWEQLQEANQELPKLRNDARQLRRQTEGLDSLRAENQRLRASISAAKNSTADGAPAMLPAGFIPRAALQDAGVATPEAAIQTFFWAMSQGNLERLAQLTTAPMGNQSNFGPGNQDAERQRLIKDSGRFPGFSVVEKNVISEDEVVLGLQTVVGGTIAPVKLRRVDNEWKMDGH